MNSEDITSPPFPNDTCTLPTLLRQLNELRTWVIDYRFWANETVMGMGSPAPLVPDLEEIPSIPELPRLHMISILDIFHSFAAMRALRERWDMMLREWEDDWDHKHCVRDRLKCVRLGFTILDNAFISPEQREARSEAAAKRASKVMKDLMRKMGVPEDLLGPGAGMAFGPGGIMMGMSEKDGDVDKLSDSELDELFNPDLSSDNDSDEE
jgi:hypothetical protein